MAQVRIEFFPNEFEGRTRELRANIYIPLALDADIERVRETVVATLGGKFGKLDGIRICEYVKATYTIYCVPGKCTILVQITSLYFIHSHDYNEVVKKIKAQSEQLESVFSVDG